MVPPTLSTSKMRDTLSASSTPSVQWWDRQRATATDIAVESGENGKYRGIAASSEILKPSQTGAGRCSRKSQGLAIILHGSWLCLLGAQFCFLNLPSFRLKGNMCLPAAERFHQPASCRRLVDSPQPHCIGAFPVPFHPSSYFC